MQNLIITNKGQELVSKLIAGQTTATFTSIATTDHDYSGATLEDLLSLEDVKQTVAISSVSVTDNAYVEITARIDNSNLTSDYYVRAVGLFAQDNETGDNILYGVSLCDTGDPDHMPAFGGKTVTGISYRFNVKVDNSAQVELVIDPAAVPSMEQVEAIEEKIVQIQTMIGTTDISDIADTLTAAIKVLDTKIGDVDISSIGDSLTEAITVLSTHKERKNAAERNSFVVVKDITDRAYDTAGDFWTKIANNDFSEVNPGNYIIGKATGTKWWIVDCDYMYGQMDSGYSLAGYAEHEHHLAIMPQQLKGGTLLWSGTKWSGTTDLNTQQGCAPWQAASGATTGSGTNDTTGAYKNSYIKNTVLPKVYNQWLKADFENYGISVLNFYELDSNAINSNASCAGYSAWTGASSNWEWVNNTDSKCMLPSIQNLTGGNGFQSSGYDCGVLKEQLAIFKAGMSYQGFMEAAVTDGYARCTWTKDVATSTRACDVYNNGNSSCINTSAAYGVRPLAFLAKG